MSKGDKLYRAPVLNTAHKIADFILIKLARKNKVSYAFAAANAPMVRDAIDLVVKNHDNIKAGMIDDVGNLPLAGEVGIVHFTRGVVQKTININ